jgi:hypothetical protein
MLSERIEELLDALGKTLLSLQRDPKTIVRELRAAIVEELAAAKPIWIPVSEREPKKTITLLSCANTHTKTSTM